MSYATPVTNVSGEHQPRPLWRLLLDEQVRVITLRRAIIDEVTQGRDPSGQLEAALKATNYVPTFTAQPRVIHAKDDVFRCTRPVSVREVEENGHPESMPMCEIRRSGEASETYHTCEEIHIDEIVIIWPSVQKQLARAESVASKEWAHQHRHRLYPDPNCRDCQPRADG